MVPPAAARALYALLTLAVLVALGVPAILPLPPASAQDPRPAEARAPAAPTEVAVPMRDGKTLAADLYLPAASGKYPTVLIQTPYGKQRMGAVLSDPEASLGETGRGAASDMQVLMDRDHYAYVVADWRGFYGSKAAMARVKRGEWRRGHDGYDTVEWIAAQPWSDGKIGTWGGSALGKQQLDTAAEHPPHLVCCVPLIAAMGQGYADYYEGGVLLEGHVQRLDQLGFGVSALVRAAPLSGALAWKLAAGRTYHPEAIAVPCLFITGWWDSYPDLVVRTFEDVIARGGPAARAGSKLLLGPWDHVSVGVARQGDRDFSGAALESGRAARAFLDRWLRGTGAAAAAEDAVPRVRYWVAGEEGWRAAESWSALPRGTLVRYLDATGGIVAARPVAPAAGDRTYRHDPRDPAPTLGGANLPPMKHGPTDHAALGARHDLLVYSTPALVEPLRLNGCAELAFTFAADRADCDFSARLCDVTPDGKALLIADAVGRAKLRDGTDQAKPLTPGATVALTLRFPPTAATLPAGHRLRLYLGSANWPRYERNPHTGADHWDAKGALDLNVTVHHDAAELRLPTLKD
ncbi:MAG: CocE/NonD family hydrolase [Planctomycetes bacterium]|nr:CocE/NonD family hydrolase [Planctomycetota bacterium]